MGESRRDRTRPPSPRRSRFSQICGWAALSTAISVVMGALENQGGVAGTIAARVVGMAWSLVTFVALPVIAIEGTGAFGTLKRSASLFRERWGQQITGNIAIGGAVALLGFLPAAILVAAGIAVWPSASFVGALLVVIGAIGFAIALLERATDRHPRHRLSPYVVPVRFIPPSRGKSAPEGSGGGRTLLRCALSLYGRGKAHRKGGACDCGDGRAAARNRHT